MDRAPNTDTRTDADTLDEVRRVEDALRRYGVDPARAIEQRDDPESREQAVSRLIATAEQVLSSEEMERLRAEIGRT